MRIATMILAGSVAALVASTPTLAKNSELQKAGDKSESAPCRAYQQTGDGSFEPSHLSHA